MNVADLVRRAAAEAPDRTALISGTERLTWAGVDSRVDAVASGLQRIGLDPGDRVALWLPNSVAFVIGWFAVLRAGLVAVPLNTGFTQHEAEHQLVDSGARLLVRDQARRAVLDAPPRSVDLVVEVGDATWQGWLAGTGHPPEAVPIRPDSLAALGYTSGTTGRPRGAMLTHRALLANIEQTATMAVTPVTSEDVVLLVLPLFHVYALNAGLDHVAAYAATAVLMERFDPVESLETVRAERVSVILGAPPMYVAWSMLPQTAAGLRHVRLAVSGSAPLPANVFARFATLLNAPVQEGYGLTEAGPIVTSTAVRDDPMPDSVGSPLPGVEVRIDRTETAATAPGVVGEVVIRGENLFEGYWPDGAGGPDKDGWFPTGDLGRFDEDGRLFLVGRRHDLILVSGFNVYPREVEQALAEHPDVAAVQVRGIPHPYTGEAVKAFVVRRAGSDLDMPSLRAFAGHRLASFKCPTAVEFVSELPQTEVGKTPRRG